MILTRKEINEEILQKNLIDRANARVIEIDLVSITLHLDDQFKVYSEYPKEPFTPPRECKTETCTVGETGHFLLPPKGKVLTCSEERIEMPLDIMGFIQTKGSLARGFLVAHMCDGQIDPGYKGRITFEIVNFSDFYYKLVPGMAIANLFFHRLQSPLEKGYEGRYQNSESPTHMQPPSGHRQT